MKMSPCGGVTRALDRACTTTLNQDGSAVVELKLINFVVAPAAADKEVGNMKEVEDEASKVGEVYIDRILLLL